MHIDMLLKWNQRINLTAVREPEEVVTRHFGESLFAAQHLFPTHVGTAAPGRPAEQSSAPQAAEPQTEGCPTLPLQRRVGVSSDRDVASSVSRVVDVGSGAGFPGLPIKIWAPEIRLTLIESNHKKATFLKEVVRTLALEGVEVFTGRAETFPASYAEVVTLRAVERFETVLPVAGALAKARGRLALLIGNSQIEQADAMTKSVEWQAPIPVPQSNNRVLIIEHIKGEEYAVSFRGVRCVL